MFRYFFPWTENLEEAGHTKLGQDEAEKDSGSEHFMFSQKSRTGLYVYARCKLCEKLLQSKYDYNSHKLGRKHREMIQNLASMFLQVFFVQSLCVLYLFSGGE